MIIIIINYLIIIIINYLIEWLMLWWGRIRLNFPFKITDSRLNMDFEVIDLRFDLQVIDLRLDLQVIELRLDLRVCDLPTSLLVTLSNYGINISFYSLALLLR